MSVKVIMTAEDIRRTLARIAHEIIERNKSMSDTGAGRYAYPWCSSGQTSSSQYQELRRHRDIRSAPWISASTGMILILWISKAGGQQHPDSYRY